MFGGMDGWGMMGWGFGGYGAICFLSFIVIVAVLIFAFRGRKP